MNTLLITGVTGFLGGAALEAIFNSQRHFTLLLLVRARDAEAGLDRVRENMRKFNVSERELALLSVENILLGDLAIPEAFLNDSRLERVTHVLNCAAVASFGNNPLIWKVNVEGTLLFAQRMSQVEGLKRFLHVGTAMSCSPQPDTLVAENAVLRERAEHLVEYAARRYRWLLLVLPLWSATLTTAVSPPAAFFGYLAWGSCCKSSCVLWRTELTLFRWIIVPERY